NNDRVGDAASCLHDLACGVRKDTDWFKYLPNICDSDLISLVPNARMGMAHVAFAKRLAVAVELLRKIVPVAEPESGPRTHEKEHRTRVTLRDRQEGPLVLGKPKKKLTNAQYNVVKALLDAEDLGLTKDELVE